MTRGICAVDILAKTPVMSPLKHKHQTEVVSPTAQYCSSHLTTVYPNTGAFCLRLIPYLITQNGRRSHRSRLQVNA